MGPLRRFAFRFAFAYLVLLVFPFPLGYLPGTEPLSKKYGEGWNAILPWIGKHLLRIDGEVIIQPTGSGDTMAGYVQLATGLVLATVAAVVWTWLARKRRPHDQLLMSLLRAYVRYGLAAAMLSYGLVKIFKLQFPFPTPDLLMKPLGEASPMGLLWRFMGYSTPYNLFGGLSEALGGVLLLFRRTTTLGALVIVGVMGNVVMLNFCYDVPVKIYSVQLVLMAVFLLLPDLRRLAAVLVLNRPAPPANLYPLAVLVRHRRLHLAAKVVLIGTMVGWMVHDTWSIYNESAGGTKHGPLYGIYEVETFARNGETIAPSLTETTRWRRAAVTDWGLKAVLMDDSARSFLMEYDAAAGTLKLTDRDGKEHLLTAALPDGEHLRVEGAIGDERIAAQLRKIDLATFTLVNRGFHWINEQAYQR